MKRILLALGTASLALGLLLPQVQAANLGMTTTTTTTLVAQSLSCDYQAEPGCVNLATTIRLDGLTGGGRFCVDIGDFRETHSPLAHGCVDLAPGQIVADGRQISVQPAVDVPAVNSADCLQAAPEDGCVPATVMLTASASFTAISDPVGYRAVVLDGSGPCVATHSVSGTRLDVTGSVTIDGFAYALSGPDASIHHFEATLVRETVRTTTTCTAPATGAEPAAH